jgi:hypothetical protein
MAERRIEIPPGQEVRISLPGGETLVLTCGDGYNSNSNSSNSSSGSEMSESFVEAVLGKRPRTKTRKGGKSKRGGSLNNNGSNLENENNSNSNVGPLRGFGPRRTVKKREPNGYMKFAAEMRPQILNQHPEMKSDVTQVAREIGKKWRALSADEKAKY